MTDAVTTAADETLLRRALRVAMEGRGRVEPNPMVGCVLAKGGVIGEGHHARFGGPHAEPNALADCHARGNGPAGATAYVTLEPCCHTNKKTPPCAPRLIAAGVARVVIGCLDPNPDVNGRGVRALRAAGIVVDYAPPALAAESRQLIAPFLNATAGRGPYLTLKWAEARDGQVAGRGGARVAITGPRANAVVHRLRGRCDAVAVGIGTVLNDDPHLLPRGVPADRTPVRVVLDTALRTRRHFRLVRSAGEGPVMIYAARAIADDLARHRDALRAAGAEVYDAIDVGPHDRLAFDQVRADWARRGWTHVLAETGPTLAASLLPVADRLWVFRSATAVDEDDAPRAARVPRAYVQTGRLALGPDTLVEYVNREAASFAAAVPSADFVREAETANLT